jgi:hypothetical protein
VADDAGGAGAELRVGEVPDGDPVSPRDLRGEPR